MRDKLNRFLAYRRGWTAGAGAKALLENDTDYECGYVRGNAARFEVLDGARVRFEVPLMSREELLLYTDEELQQRLEGSSMKIHGMGIDDYTLVLQDGKKEMERTCLKCGERKPLREFGLRLMTDKKEIRSQSQCTTCRGKE
jgi:hypothetical protein